MMGGMHQRFCADAWRPFVDRVTDDVGPKEALLAPVPHRAFAEGEAVRDLVERRRLAGDALETRHGEINVHGRAPLVPRRRAAGRIGNAAVAPPQRRDLRHLVLAEREIEYREVLRDALPVRRARDRRDAAVLERPAQRDLRDAPAPAAGDVADDRIVDQTPAAERTVAGED